jgi:RNA polymerase sigma factor (sigma-70 family)
MRKFRGDAQFSTWLYRITANCAATQLGRRRRHQHEALDEEATVYDTTPEHDPAAVADAAHLRERLEDAIADLPPRLRAVVVLRDIYDLNHAEIADELGISESAAKVRLHRARRKLRTQVFPLRPARPPRSMERSTPMRCDRVRDRATPIAEAVAPAPGRGRRVRPLDRAERRHVEQCLRCQAELAQYRKLLRAMRLLRTDVGAVPDRPGGHRS